MKFIKSIQIRKFRSVKSITRGFSPDSLTLLVGNNDQGKSNILRAMNLFFNGETDYGSPFRFDDDYCFLSDRGTGTRKEIRVDLVIDPPKHRFRSAEPIRWTKKWKQDGSVIETRVVVSSGEDLSRSSNIYKWLDKIRFRYVPAVKGAEYFSILMSSLHDVLSESYEDDLGEQGQNFISGIQRITSGITHELENRLGLSNAIQVPSDFKLLFSNLDFGVDVNGDVYRLKNRGDGIKVRHIPIILKYMADQERSVSIPGYVKPDTIWGFEEPENNLEMSNAFDMARTFKEYCADIQVFVSTHSPAFYSLDEFENDGVVSFFVEKTEDECTEIERICQTDAQKIHERMGMLPLITPYLEEAYRVKKELDELSDRVSQEVFDAFVLTEDSDPNYLRLLLEANGFDLDNTKIQPYKGSGNLNAALCLADYVVEKHEGVSVLIHRDRDYLTTEQISELVDKVERRGYTLFITDGVDLESHFILSGHLRGLYPELDELDDLIDEAIHETSDDSFGRFLNERMQSERPISNDYAGMFRRLKTQFDSEAKPLMYGKKVLSRVKGKIQRATGSNVELFTVTDELRTDILTEFSEQIW